MNPVDLALAIMLMLLGALLCICHAIMPPPPAHWAGWLILAAALWLCAAILVVFARIQR